MLILTKEILELRQPLEFDGCLREGHFEHWAENKKQIIPIIY